MGGGNPDYLPCGSSPRAWGTLHYDTQRYGDIRFIPTCMGNAQVSTYMAKIRAVHPHVHGERLPYRPFPSNLYGSSPRAWGTRPYRAYQQDHRRFIPTCMGNASSGARRVPCSSVHPHVHGERRLCPTTLPINCGSSPRAWGTRARPGAQTVPIWFIPTCMGNASSCASKILNISVHPHVHGER